MRMGHQFRCVCVLSVALSIVQSVVASTEHDGMRAALNLIPADAPVALVVPNLADLSHKIAKLNEEALGSSVPQMADVLGTMKLMGGAIHGVNDAGAFVAYITSIEGLVDDNHASEPPYVVLVPVSDYAAFVGNFGGNADAAMTELTLTGGSQGFAKKVGGYAAISATQELVAGYENPNAVAAIASGVGAVGRQSFSISDVFVVANFKAMAPVIMPKLQELMGMFEEGFEQGLAEEAADPEVMQLGQTIMRLYIDGIRAMVRDTSMAVAGLDITSKGVGMSYTLQLEPESKMGQVITTGGGAARQLARLSNGPYMFASGMDFQGIDVPALLNKVLAKFPEEGEGDGAGGFMSVLKQEIDLGIHTKGMGMAYLLPKADPNNLMPMMGGAGLNAVVVIETADGDGAAYLKKVEKLILDINGLKLGDMDPAGGPDAQPMTMNAKYTPNVMQIDGVQVDSFQVQYQLPPQMMQEMGPMAPMMMMMGGMGYNGYAAANGSCVVMTTTTDAATMKLALASASQQDGGLGVDGPIKRVREMALLNDPTYESYISIPGVMGMGNMFLGMMGQAPVEVPADMPPVAMAKSIKDHGVSIRVYVPIDVIKFGKDLVDRMSPQPPGNGAEPDAAGQGRGQGPPPAPF